jgi:hypothetical protein
MTFITGALTWMNHVQKDAGNDGRRIESKSLIASDWQKHTTGGIPRWSPTLVLVARFSAYVWQSGRDAQFSLTYGRMYLNSHNHNLSLYDTPDYM